MGANQISRSNREHTVAPFSGTGKHGHDQSISNVYSKPWKFVSACLLLATLFQAIRPSDSYHPKFFIGQKGISKEDVNSEIFEWRTFTYLAALLPVTFLSETFIGYVPLIIFGLLCRLGTQFVLYFGNGIPTMRLGYALFGFSQSTQIIYSAHLYRMVPLKMFHRITGFLRATVLFAYVLGGFLGGTLMNMNGKGDTNWRLIFGISQTSVSVGISMFIVACYFSWKYMKTDDSSCAVVTASGGEVQPDKPSSVADSPVAGDGMGISFHESPYRFFVKKCTQLLTLLRSIYSSPTVVVWSCWWWFGFATVDIIIDYIPVLFNEVNGTDINTGFIFSLAHLAAAGTSLLAGASGCLLNGAYGFLALSICSFLIGCLLFSCSIISNICICYAIFVVYLGLNEYCYVASYAQVAIRIPESLRGVALLTNTLFGMAIETTLQIVGKQLDLRIQHKFMMYAGVMIAIGFLISAAFFLVTWKNGTATISEVKCNSKSDNPRTYSAKEKKITEIELV